MNLAFCLFKYFPFGGLQQDFLRIARACVKRGHTVKAFCLSWQGPVPYWLPVSVLATMRFSNHGRCRAFYHSLKSALRREPFDLVVGFDKMPGLDVYYAADICYRGRAASVHAWPYFLTRRYRHFAAFEEAVFNASANTVILTISEKEQRNYEYYYGTPSERFHLLPPGVSRDFIPPEDIEEKRTRLRKELFSGADRIAMLFVGSDYRRKGLDRALQAMAALPPSSRQPLCLHVLGQDNARPFQRMEKRLGIQQHVRFWEGQGEVPQFFFAADLLIHPAYSENTGTVLLEAVTAGLPVITTDVCGYAHHIEAGRTGIVVSSPFTTKALTAALEHMLVFRKRTLFAQNAQKYAATHDLHSLPEKAAEIIEHCGEATAKKKGEV